MHSTLLLYLIFNNRQAKLAAVVFFLLSHAPSTLLELDKAAEDLTAARDGCKSCQREIRTACRKRVLNANSSSYFFDRANGQHAPRWIVSSWYFLHERFGPGDKPS